MRVLRAGATTRYVVLLLFIGLGVLHWRYINWLSEMSPPALAPDIPDGDLAKPSIAFGGIESPIRELMINATAKFEKLLGSRTTDMWLASGRYRVRRGRHPPPGFDKWVEAAADWNAVIVEDFFDGIYKDLTPFWGLDPKVLRERARAWPTGVRIRSGNVVIHGPDHKNRQWLKDWAYLIQEFAKDMPDLDMPVNLADEARLLVPFQEINALVRIEAAERQLTPLANVKTDYMSLVALDYQKVGSFEPDWLSSQRSSWDIALATCSPSTAAYMGRRSKSDSQDEVPQDWRPKYTINGFVQNWTAATDPCEQPHLRHMHPAFNKQRDVPATGELFPLFSSSKLSMNNDILIPAAIYLNSQDPQAPEDALKRPWGTKSHKVFWRGEAERLLKMLDGNLISQLEATEEKASGISLPPKDLYPSERRERAELGSWLGSIADATADSPESTRPFSQFENRFLPDVDGHSASPRFQSILRSSSLPLRSSLFKEWFDDRLVPWVHFVPLDSTLQDLHAVLEFFADGSGSGDAAARFIADRGADWSEKVMRRDDMKLYVWRLLLEWARLVDENRETLSFVDDVREHAD